MAPGGAALHCGAALERASVVVQPGERGLATGLGLPWSCKVIVCVSFVCVCMHAPSN